MSDRDLPPAQTIQPVDPPPDLPRPTAAMLKADVDSGRTGDKNPVRDPALAPLGTDDEAAGRRPSSVRVALARYHETVGRWIGDGGQAGAAHHKQDGVPVVFIGFIVAVGVILLAGMWAASASLPPRL